jgi:nitrogen fixation protein FixH
MADGVVVGLDRAVEEKDRAAVTLAPAGDEGRYRIAEVVPAVSGRWAAEVWGHLTKRTIKHAHAVACQVEL